MDVAFYLRRAFKEHENLVIFNDLKITHLGENAQIDHLLVYSFGFILIESKSINGKVRVNAQQEWSRSYQGQWQGMPSPIKQVELQQKLLRALLSQHRSEIIGKIFLKQQSFGGRCWNNLCAVSSNAIIERRNMPKEIDNQLVKSEFLVDKIHDVMKLRNKLVNALNILDTRPAFNPVELDSICQFLLNHTRRLAPNSINEDINGSIKSTDTQAMSACNFSTVHSVHETIAEYKVFEDKIASPHTGNITLKCKKCTETNKLIPSYGKFGYYIKCQVCDANTAMKSACRHCNSKDTKVSKRKTRYSLICNHCDKTSMFASFDSLKVRHKMHL